MREDGLTQSLWQLVMNSWCVRKLLTKAGGVYEGGESVSLTSRTKNLGEIIPSIKRF